MPESRTGQYHDEETERVLAEHGFASTPSGRARAAARLRESEARPGNWDQWLQRARDLYAHQRGHRG